MKLTASEHTSRPWRIHEIVGDFRLEDVWELKAPGRADDFEQLVAGFTTFDPAESSSAIVRFLFALRWKLGDWFGWDDDSTGINGRVRSLSERLPADLRAHPGPDLAGVPFTSLYQLDNEYAAEIANETMHGVVHLGWVPEEGRAQMAVLVKTNGLFGQLYMLGIRPFRHVGVYPVLLREIENRWQAGIGSA